MVKIIKHRFFYLSTQNMTFFVEIDKEAKTFILVVNRLLLLTNKNPCRFIFLCENEDDQLGDWSFLFSSIHERCFVNLIHEHDEEQ